MPTPFTNIQTMQHFFQLDEEGERLIGKLSERLRRLVLSAVDYNALIQPGRVLTYKLYMGEKWQYPRLTDTSTLNGVLTEQAGLDSFATFQATSTVKAKSLFSPHYFAGDEQIVDRNIRYLLLTPDDATDDDVEQNRPAGRYTHLYREIESAAPVFFDALREVKRRRRERIGKMEIKPFEPPTVARINSSEFSHHPWMEIAPGKAASDAPKAVIIAMHWLQSGGAERWAMETVALARQAGLLPIVITDSDGHQPWITRHEFDDTVLLPLTMPLQDRVGDAPLLRALFEQFNIVGVLIHHCQWMYDNAWWVKHYFPETHVVDSLHIVEYIFHGGYPSESVARDEWIDLHHVISPQLEHWLEDVHHIDPKKVVDAPLVGLTADSGDMDEFVDQLIKRYDLETVIQRRSMTTPVSQTYDQTDVLLVSSMNEGITLTTIEALSAGIPVISANVGSQDTLIPPQGLCRRESARFVRDVTAIVGRILESEENRKKLWEAEKNRLEKFSELKSANEYFRDMLTKWSR